MSSRTVQREGSQVKDINSLAVTKNGHEHNAIPPGTCQQTNGLEEYFSLLQGSQGFQVSHQPQRQQREKEMSNWIGEAIAYFLRKYFINQSRERTNINARLSKCSKRLKWYPTKKGDFDVVTSGKPSRNSPRIPVKCVEHIQRANYHPEIPNTPQRVETILDHTTYKCHNGHPSCTTVRSTKIEGLPDITGYIVLCGFCDRTG